MAKKRSVGVTVFGGVFIFIGLFVLLGESMIKKELGHFDFNNIRSFITVAILLISGCGILALKEWSRRLTIFLVCISLLIYIISVITACLGIEGFRLLSPKRIIQALPSNLILLGILFYFTSPKVKEQFK